MLLHPSSLPSGHLGSDAYRFIDFLSKSSFAYWQVLPFGPTHADLSPYNSLSAFACNPSLLTESVKESTDFDENNFVEFQKEHAWWLRDYSLFSVIKNHQQQKHWTQWEEALRDRQPEALLVFSNSYADEIRNAELDQYRFFEQWSKIKQYANDRQIKIIGDLPFFVAYDSADVWRHRQLFKLDAMGNASVVAGVPPDGFSDQGQRWGNPLYCWAEHEAQYFDWWLKRFRHALSLFDWVRIDHFRGFEACWEVPGNEETAINGRWVKTPGNALFETLSELITPLPLIAEDLGHITPEVTQLLNKFDLPGMSILQFAFDSDSKNSYLPHNHIPNCVVYTGTHDNNTSKGWFDELDDAQRERVLNYYSWPNESMPWPLVKSALASVSKLAIIPLQDLLSLGKAHRMNTPATTEGNWLWQFEWGQINETLTDYLHELNQLYRRTAN